MIEDNYRQRGLRNKLVKKIAEKGIRDERVLRAIGRVNALIGVKRRKIRSRPTILAARAG